jgi:arsenite/tail-anchored protein-transporting ATPase
VSAADALVKALPRVTLIVGKGGVGKTTCAAALATGMAASDRETLVVTTDPAKALPEVLGQPVSSQPTPVADRPGLSAQVLDADALRARFMERWSGVIRQILDRGTYLDDSDIAPLVDTALPGSDEIFAALELARLIAESRAPRAASRVVVDTAPTGHTLRLLNLPRTFRALVRLLDAMQDKHRFMVRTLTRAYRADEADAFLAEMSALVTGLEETLRDPDRCAAVMVANDQALVLEETRRYLGELRGLRVRVAAIVWNGVDDPGPPFDGIDAYVVPRLDTWPTGSVGLRRWTEALHEAEPRTSRPPKTDSRRRPPKAKSGRRAPGRPWTNDDLDSLIGPLTIVAGKGGVGKTTVACAIALHAAGRSRTLLVSTDPAPSVGDALGQEIGDADTPVAGAPKLSARQMDASAAFARLRSEYETRVDALFQGLVARGVDLAHDRAVARDLLALAPPGIDEVYALSLLSDALFKDRFDRVVVDPAPTGHLLRLLEMPKLALAWSHQLLRLMLKYKEVAGLGETAQEILDFSRSLRAVDALLHDPARCGVVLVALAEPVVLQETRRLRQAVADRGVAVRGVILNRAGADAAAGAPIAMPDALAQFRAPATDPPPAGVDALRDWTKSWTSTVSRQA